MINRQMGKIIQYNLDPEEGDQDLYALTFRMSRALLSTVEYFRWQSRHRSLPADLNTKDALDEWVSEVEQRLMMPIEICAKIIECLATDTDVQDAVNTLVQNSILNDPEFLKSLADAISPLLPSEITQPLNPEIEEDCHDVLWAQCKAIAQYTHTAVSDVLQVIEVQTNQIELLTHLELIPFFKAANTIVPITDVVELVNWWVEAIHEQYDANFDESETPDGTIWKIAEALFCICEHDCTITLERIWDAYNGLLGGTLALNWDTVQDLIETAAGIDDNSLILVYAAHCSLWGFAKLTRKFGIGNYDAKSVGTIMYVAQDEATDEWEGLVDCVAIDQRIPIIDTVWDSANGAGGTLTGPDEDGFYTVTSTDGGSDQQFHIMDTEHRPFILEGWSYPLGSPTCEVLIYDAEPFSFWCDGFSHYTGQTCTEIHCVKVPNTAVFSLKFKMKAPES